MSENRRVLRVEREIKHALSELFIHGLKIPLPGLATVVHVDATPDLRSANVFVKVAGSAKDRSEAEALLEKQRKQIQHEINERLQTKFCPILRFKVGGESGNTHLDEVEKMLANLHRRPE
jgi:ribosome-binding factor A